jgi:hypothetical protein
MDTCPTAEEPTEATVEEVAAWLSATEGRAVSVHEVRRIEAQAAAGIYPARAVPC